MDTLATAPYATTDDMLKEHSDLTPWRPPIGITPGLSDAELVDSHRRQELFGRDFERELSEHGVQLLRPARKGERERPGAALFRPLRQVIESIDETFKGQHDLERHRGRTPGGVIAHVMQRILALTAAIWHNDATGQTVLRSLAP